ncbi:MAG: hypothetical protein SF052_13675 [Bacteroidia bacterium]|nr:hypothetical protein [Bacteroidia bacterium]
MTRQRYFFLLLLPLVTTLLGGCNQTRDVILPHTTAIFPVAQGLYRISEVIDTTFNTGGAVAARFYKKEEISGTETDLTGRTVYRLDTYHSDFDRGLDFDWKYYLLGTIFYEPRETGDYYAERTENNVRIQVLRFPVHTLVSWNGNLYNNLGAQEFYYGNVDTSVVVKGVTYDHCVMVVQEKTEGLIRQSFAYEIYAPEIGLIKKYNRTLVNDGAMGEFNPDKSRIYIEELVEHN